MTEPYRIRSPETWAQARDDYLGGLSAEAVCVRYDVGLSAFRRRARKYGWRRADQDDPAPRDPEAGIDLSIYDDISLDDMVRTAWQRFTRALDRGLSVEAGRWRRLWRELDAESRALDAEVFAGMTRTEIARMMAADADRLADDESEAEVALLTAQSAAARLVAPRIVHDVHPLFSSAHFPPDEPPGSPPRSPAARPDPWPGPRPAPY